MLSDEFVKASPANARAVLETVAALEKQGHECVEFKIPQRKSMGITVSNPLYTDADYLFTQQRVRWSSSF
jgi:Asp-tRNA(Asn)/Glu-tRNA(Gln) amidotransferase A subunit family amidase